MLGTMLLNDYTGAITDGIAQQCMRSAYQINTQMLMRWVQGQGRLPVTWGTLVNVLKSLQLNVLARDIEFSLQTAQQVSGYY